MGVWKPTTKYGVVVKDYQPRTEHCLALSLGDTVQIAEETQTCEWFRGCVTRKGKRGIFPANHVHIKPSALDSRGQIVPVEDPVAREVGDVLREWGVIIKQLYKDRNDEFFMTLKAVMHDLLGWRSKILSGTLPDDALAEIKNKVTAKIDWGNREMGLDLIPRAASGEHVDGSNASIVELFRIHHKSVETGRHASTHGSIRRPSPVKRVLPPIEQCQLFFRHLVCLCSIEEEKEVFFYVYDAKAKRFISEPYIVRLSAKGLPHNVDKIDNMTCLFTELSTKRVDPTTGQAQACDFYIVCQLLRRGPMELGSKLKRPLFRRPVGAGAVSIQSFLEQSGGDDSEVEFNIPMSKCSEEDFHQLHEFIIHRQSSKFAPLPSAKGVKISLKQMHGELSQIRKKNPLLFKKGTVIARKLGFPEVIMPGDVRNDVYINLFSANFERGNKSAARNIECTVSVCLKDGTKLNDCFVVGAGEIPLPEYTSCIYYHSNSPRWNETFKLDVPIEKFDQAHLKFYFKHCSKDKQDRQQIFCFAFLPLMDDGSTVKDGVHEVQVYKYDPIYDSSNQGQPPYLVNPASLKFSEGEKLTVSTLACSTKLTQNPYLLQLLKWRAHPPQKLQDILGHIKFVEPEEIVKFLTDIFDAVFTILDMHPTHAELVFEQALVPTIGLLSDKKFHNFTPVLDAYIEKHFSGAMAHKYLVSCMNDHLSKANDVSFGKKLRDAIKAIEYLIKFIVRSRKLFNRNKQAVGDDVEFKTELKTLFKSFNGMMRLTAPASVIGTQTTTLQHFSSIFPDLGEIFSMSELSSIAREFLQSVQYPDKGPSQQGGGPTKGHSQLSQHKLNFINALVQGPVLQTPDGRRDVVGPIMQIIAKHLKRKDEVDLACDVLGDTLNLLSSPSVGDTVHDVTQVVNTVLLDVLDGAISASRGHPGYEMQLVDLLTIFHLMNNGTPKSTSAVDGLVGDNRSVTVTKHDFFSEFVTHLNDRDQLRQFLQNVFEVFTKLVEQSAFPTDWLVMGMLQNDVVLHTVQNLSGILVDRFSKGSQFNKDLWDKFFRLSVSYLTQKTLQVENFSESKREKVLGKADKRELMGQQVADMWQLLGDNQAHFIPSLVGPFLEMALVPNSRLRKLAIPIFFNMIERQVRQQGSFKELEVHIIDKLDAHVTAGRGDMEFKELFRSVLTQLSTESDSKVVQETVPAAIESVTQLMSRLLHLRNVPHGDEHRDERANCIYNLMEFYRETNRQAMYIRYIYKLKDIHVSAEHFTEGAFTLRLHADLLEWSDEQLEADGDRFPQPQKSRERKAQVYREVIDLFAKGQTWENAIPLCKELATQYESELFDFRRLSDILKRMAQFYDNICTGSRLEPQYFRVCYYGQGFPPGVRNKEFVYRGLKANHISVFCDRIQQQFPKAALLMKNAPPSKEMLEGHDTHIMICKVSPLHDGSKDRFKGRPVDKALNAFYESNEVQRFEYIRPFRKGEKTGNEFETLWTEQVKLDTKAKMPWYLNRSEIEKTERHELSPIENAVNTMVDKNEELKEIIGRHAQDPSLNINPLTMALNGVIDAAVMGGTEMYRKAFFTPEYTEKNPGHEPFVEQLERLIEAQTEILDSGLVVHGKYCPSDLQPMQQKLEMQLTEMKSKSSSSPERKKTVSAGVPAKAAVASDQPKPQRRATSVYSAPTPLKHTPKTQSFSGTLPSKTGPVSRPVSALREENNPVPPPRSSSMVGVRPGSTGKTGNPFPVSVPGTPAAPTGAAGSRLGSAAATPTPSAAAAATPAAATPAMRASPASVAEEAPSTPAPYQPAPPYRNSLSPPEPPIRRSTPSSPNPARRSVNTAPSSAAPTPATPATPAAGQPPARPKPKPKPGSFSGSPTTVAAATAATAAASPAVANKPPRPSTASKPRVSVVGKAASMDGSPATPSRNPFEPPAEQAPARPPKRPELASAAPSATSSAAASPNPFRKTASGGAPPPRPRSSKPSVGKNPFAPPETPPDEEPPPRPPKKPSRP